MGKKSPTSSSSSSPTSSSCNDNSGNGSTENSVKSIKKKKIYFRFKCVHLIMDGDGTEYEKKLAARKKAFLEESPFIRKSFSERGTKSRLDGLDLSNFDMSIAPAMEYQEYRIYVGTWNVGGRTPTYNEVDLNEFLHIEGSSDIYVVGFQEIVPLNAGNVLVVEDNEPAARWLALINVALNGHQQDYMHSDSSPSSKSSSKDSKSNLFQKPNLKVLSKNLRVDSSLVKTCNCCLDSLIPERRRARHLSDNSIHEYNRRAEELFPLVSEECPHPSRAADYRLISSKQMVGIFLSVWARKELIPYIGHVRVCTMGTGIMGCLGNKGCISISMTLHRTSFCFVCSHLASGEKEGDELKRNADVAEILKGTQFPKICKNTERKAPEKIIDHDRVLWFGDLNYRMTLPYEETKILLEGNDWETLLQKDQLNIERESGRVFGGWKEGRIKFAPTYKYTQNSDTYAGENAKSKKKRRTPAWCDRILWHGQGIQQLVYLRGESRFSDHRPVCAVFAVDVEVRRKISNRFRKGYSCTVPSLGWDYMPERHSFYEC
ncbi:hypothetical protein Cgig2_024115 [Carnegiea gigantea]|uniref:Inositol polyphosphate-related phosphatase domain-containing protein n=1 Tax=Carnegiea gigantea TaxID=171969 RepID=A0A9Q1H0A4_9CARY|nr:hypothetical protein Cgig2_024115 [Carnegiea gigantea]